MKVSKLASWMGLIVGTATVGAAVIGTMNIKENLGEGISRPAQIAQLSDKIYPVNLKYEYGEISREDFKITLELDQKTDTVYLGNYTQNYDKQNWQGSNKEKIPIYARHTRINPFSRTFILHPKEVKIKGIEQKIFLVPQYSWDQDAKPYEQHKEAQQMIEGGERIIDFAIGKIPIPYFSDFFNNWIQSGKDEEKIKIREMVNKVREGYTATIIPSYIKNNLLGSVETAREYKIKLDAGEVDGEVQLYLLTKIVLGDSTNAPSGSFPNKYGELENVVLEFSLRGGKVKGAKNIKEKVNEKKFKMCIYDDGSKNRSGQSPINEVIFYIKNNNMDWEEFYRSQNACADNQITLENPNSYVYVKAIGKYDNGMGNQWTCVSDEKRVSWNSESRVELSGCSQPK